MTALWPPKPNELLMTTSTSCACAVCATKLTEGSIGRSQLTVGGTDPSLMTRAPMMASTAPAAPIMWPVIDLVELTGMDSMCVPNTARSELSSLLSLSWVPVPCALT